MDGICWRVWTGSEWMGHFVDLSCIMYKYRWLFSTVNSRPQVINAFFVSSVLLVVRSREFGRVEGILRHQRLCVASIQAVGACL